MPTSNAKPQNLKIVFFTNKTRHGAELLNGMRNNDIIVDAIFIEKPSTQEYLEKFKKNLKKYGVTKTIKKIIIKLKHILRRQNKAKWLIDDFYSFYSKNVHVLDDLNGEQCERLLHKIRPGVIVLGGTRIISKKIIKIPTRGILNAHPGLLPKYRGVDVIPWAIYNGDEIGVTVHFIDEGVDTGGIIKRRTIKIERNDTINSLKRKAEILAGEMISDTIIEIDSNREIHVAYQSKSDGRQYYKMPRKVLRETKRRLNEIRSGIRNDNKLL